MSDSYINSAKEKLEYGLMLDMRNKVLTAEILRKRGH